MFNYYESPLPGLGAQQENPFITSSPQQSQQQPQIDPMAAMNMYSQFSGGGGGGLFGGGTGAGAGGAAGASSASGGSAAGGGAAGASSGGSSSLSSAGPWAALAAVIIGNETSAMDQGRRSKDDSQYATDLIGGKVIEQDMPYFSDKVFGDDDLGFGDGWKAFGEFNTFDFSNGFKSLEDRFKKLF